MENRFTFKDFLLFVLLSALIIEVGLAMKQFDRQWMLMKTMQDTASDQVQNLAQISRQLNQLQNSGPMAMAPVAPPTTRSAPGTSAPSDDPFARIKSAQAMSGYAQGDWYVDSGPNSDKLTPLVSGDTFGAEVQSRIFESLITRDPVTLDWLPLVASGWKVEDNTSAYNDYIAKQKTAGKTDKDIEKDSNLPTPVTIRFKMRPGVVFSDGVLVTAQDVAWTFAWIMNPAVEAPRERAYFNKIKSCTADGDEVVFEFREPYFDALGLSGGMNILPKHFYAKYSPEDFNKSTGLLLGSGPYRMENPTDWSPGKQVVLFRNERYWGTPAAFSRIVYTIIDNDLARLTAFSNGEIDFFSAQPEQYRQLLKNKELVARTRQFAYETAVGGYRYIAWNEKHADGSPTLFADKRVRQAMTMLTDRQHICDDVMLGFATISTGPFSRLGKQSNPNVKAWPYDIEKARALLKEAGYVQDASGVLRGSGGKPFTFKLTYPTGNATYDRIALFLRDSYAKAGIAMDLDALDWSVFSDRLKTRNFDAITLGWSAGIEDDIFQMFDSSQIADQGDDFTSYKNPELDHLIETARATVDEKTRLPMWQKCHAILHEDQPYTFLFTRKSLIFIDKRISNVQEIPLGLNDLVEWYVPRGQSKWEK